MRYLLDVNVLIALIDRYHIYHDLAHTWLAKNGPDGWATCAITENGLVRIVSNKNYSSEPRLRLDLGRYVEHAQICTGTRILERIP